MTSGQTTEVHCRSTLVTEQIFKFYIDKYQLANKYKNDPPGIPPGPPTPPCASLPGLAGDPHQRHSTSDAHPPAGHTHSAQESVPLLLTKSSQQHIILHSFLELRELGRKCTPGVRAWGLHCPQSPREWDLPAREESSNFRPAWLVWLMCPR